MARVEIPLTVISTTTGLPLSGVPVRVQFRATGTDASLFTTEAGTTTTSNPTTTDASGRVNAWVERGAYNLRIGPGGGVAAEVVQEYDAAPAGDSTVDAAWIPTGGIALAKLAADVGRALVPAGGMMQYGGTTLPTGYLWCDGAEVDAQYTALISALAGNPYGFGANNRPRVPDLRSKTPIGANGASAGAPGLAGGLTSRAPSSTVIGAETQGLDITHLPAHSHTGNMPDHVHDFSSAAVQVVGGGGSTFDGGGTGRASITQTGGVIGGGGLSITTSTVGSGTPHNNMQPSLAVNYIIRHGH